MMIRAFWDNTRADGAKLVEGWISLHHIVCVERSSRDRLSQHGQTVAVPVARVQLRDGREATCEGIDAVHVFRVCELLTRSSLPGDRCQANRPPVLDLDDLRAGGMGDMAAAG